MPLNHKLTNVIRGRVIRRFQESGGELLIGFHDGSAMRIREMETNSPPLAVGAQIKLIEEDGAEFTIRCEDGTSLFLQLTDPGAAVFVFRREQRGRVFGLRKGTGTCHRLPIRSRGFDCEDAYVESDISQSPYRPHCRPLFAGPD